MGSFTLPLQWQLAPQTLHQPILSGWDVSLFKIDLGRSSDPTLEAQALAEVGSYGKQMGHLAEALEVLIERLKLLDHPEFSKDDCDVLKTVLGDVVAVRRLKHRRR